MVLLVDLLGCCVFGLVATYPVMQPSRVLFNLQEAIAPLEIKISHQNFPNMRFYSNDDYPSPRSGDVARATERST